MSNVNPAPVAVTDLVIEFVRHARMNAEKWENQELLDDSQVYSLHRLAGTIYAAGWDAGHRVGRRESDPIR